LNTPRTSESTIVGFTRARKLLDQVCDPEIPVLSIDEIGILRDVEENGNTVSVIITPTYSGCPAIDRIKSDITEVLTNAGYESVEIKLQLAPAWTTDWMPESAKEKLRQYGIAPPCRSSASNSIIPMQMQARCPRCRSMDTRLVSEFGSTSCKALYQCRSCLEPFDYFKPI